MTCSEIVVGALPSRVWTGGEGEPLVLLHGGWGGAAMHWSRVWEDLASRCRVVAPELPGIAAGTVAGPRSFDAFAAWLDVLLEALALPRAWLVGNSFGAAVAWQYASRRAARCRGLVLVNGMAPPRLPLLVRAALALPPLRRRWTGWYRRVVFGPEIVGRAYADPALAPPELLRVLADPPPVQLEVLRDVLLGGTRPAPPPRVPALVVWGEADRIPGLDADAARRVQRSLAGAKLVLVPAAGHMPQVERPREFVDAITSFLSTRTDGGGRDDGR